MKSTARRLQLLAPAIGLVVGLSTFALPAVAGQLVTFSRGHSLVVQSAERRGDWYYLTLDGGGQIGDIRAEPPNGRAVAFGLGAVAGLALR